MKEEQRGCLRDLTEKEQQVVTEFVQLVRQRFGSQVRAIVLFGSRARGEAEADSDMDVLVVMASADPPTREEIRHLAAELWLEHGIFLSTRVWSLSHWHRVARLRTAFYGNVCRDGIDLLETASPSNSCRSRNPHPPALD